MTSEKFEKPDWLFRKLIYKKRRTFREKIKTKCFAYQIRLSLTIKYCRTYKNCAFAEPNFRCCYHSIFGLFYGELVSQFPQNRIFFIGNKSSVFSLNTFLIVHFFIAFISIFFIYAHRFNVELGKIQKENEANNLKRRFPYTLLSPAVVPNSISI